VIQCSPIFASVDNDDVTLVIIFSRSSTSAVVSPLRRSKIPSDFLIMLRLLAFAALFCCGSVLAADSKPNIILIYSDDHGFADLGAQGIDQDIRTPHLDALARDGVRMANGYVTAPQCVPSRAGVLTGRHQNRFGLEDNTQGPMPTEELTIAELLKPAGYVSCQVGKWHLEPPPSRGNEKQQRRGDVKDRHPFLPLGQGFDEYFTGPMNSFIASHDLAGNQLDDAPQTLTDKRFRCVWQTDAATSFIDRHHSEPFFLYLAYFAPHVPLESPEPWYSKTPEELPLERRQAIAMIAAMDEGIGKVRDKLREHAIERNTLIVFISDNGAPLKTGAWNGSLNLPLVGEKGMLTDGGIRVPFVAAWPGTLPAGKVYQPIVSSLDVAATATELAGLPKNESLDGVNLIPFLTEEKQGSPHEALFWRWRSQAAVRSDHWKLILLDRQRFLFDLNSPEGETKNRLAEFLEVAANLEAKLMAWNETLPPPGLPRQPHPQDGIFFDTHVFRTGSNASKAIPRKNGKASASDSVTIQGWVGRNCDLSVNEGSLLIASDHQSNKGKPFISNNDFDLAGPITAELQLLCLEGGTGQISWRLSGQRDFNLDQTATFEVEASTQWQTVQVKLPATGRMIHLRLQIPSAPNIAIKSIALQSAAAKTPVVWRDFE
jgi:arylsulfatase A-like enzyme